MYVLGYWKVRARRRRLLRDTRDRGILCGRRCRRGGGEVGRARGLRGKLIGRRRSRADPGPRGAHQAAVCVHGHAARGTRGRRRHPIATAATASSATADGAAARGGGRGGGPLLRRTLLQGPVLGGTLRERRQRTAEVGAAVGAAVGEALGETLGLNVGCSVGFPVRSMQRPAF